MTEKARTAAAEVAELSREIEEGKQAIAQKDSRIKRLEEVRLTNHQVEKLQAMKTSARKTAAENRELKQRLAVLEEGRSQAGGGAGGSSSSGLLGTGEAPADLAAATERIAELQGAKKNVVEKLRVYGKRVHDLEKEHMRVRAAVEQMGVSASEGRDLGDAVLEVAQRASGSDASMMSSFSSGEGSAVAAAAAAAAAAAERHHAELEEMSAALRKGEADRSALKEQMIAGVSRFRELEARETRAREALEAAELEKMEAVNAAVKAKEKDHERQLKFLQVWVGGEEPVRSFFFLCVWTSDLFCYVSFLGCFTVPVYRYLFGSMFISLPRRVRTMQALIFIPYKFIFPFRMMLCTWYVELFKLWCFGA